MSFSWSELKIGGGKCVENYFKYVEKCPTRLSSDLWSARRRNKKSENLKTKTEKTFTQ